MTKEEYNTSKQKIREEADKKQRALDIEFAVSNAPAIVKGDILYTKYEIGRVQKGIATKFSMEYPQVYYKCDRLTKKLEVNKRDPEVSVFQHEIIKVKKAATGEIVEFSELAKK